MHLLKRSLLGVLSVACVLSYTPIAFAQGAAVRFAGDSDVGEGGRWTRKICEEWAQKSGNKLEYINRPNSATETLALFQQYWAAKSPDVDVYMIDVIWPGIAAAHAADLKKYFTDDDLKAHFQSIVKNNTVGDQLVAVPMFTDAGMLYYRTDLLQKYGYQKPPETWDELTEMAAKIQEGERKEKADFFGFVWQGKTDEGLTCDALEWIYSYGGGSIVEADKKVSINNPNAIKAIEMAKGWVDKISPRGVTTYGEEEARNVYQAGNAAFMRNWPYAYALGQSEGSVIKDKIGVVVLPKGGADGKHAATLGGWNLMVTKYSKNQEAAADLVKFLCSAEVQKRRAVDLSQLPTLPALYDDPDVLQKNPWFKEMKDVLSNSVARPATALGANYNQVATAVFQNVNRVLNGQTTAKDAVAQIERTAKRFVR
jgi:trehalose/maltose transport system substrate-binding protein